MAKIIFSDNSVIEAEQNGNNYIVEEKPDFPEDLTDVVIEGDQGTEIIKNGAIVECFPLDSRYWFTIIEKPESEVLKEQILDIECIMADLLEMI